MTDCEKLKQCFKDIGVPFRELFDYNYAGDHVVLVQVDEKKVCGGNDNWMEFYFMKGTGKFDDLYIGT